MGALDHLSVVETSTTSKRETALCTVIDVEALCRVASNNLALGSREGQLGGEMCCESLGLLLGHVCVLRHNDATRLAVVASKYLRACVKSHVKGNQDLGFSHSESLVDSNSVET